MDVYLRSFAPWESFGGGFEGDNRGPSTSLDATSRISGRVTINAATGEILGQEVTTSGTRCIGEPCMSAFGPEISVSDVSINTRSANGVLTLSIAGSNPKFGGFAPDIDATLTLNLSDFSGRLVGDAFPSAEAFIVGPGGARMLHTFSTPGGAQTGLWRLFGENSRAMGGF